MQILTVQAAAALVSACLLLFPFINAVKKASAVVGGAMSRTVLAHIGDPLVKPKTMHKFQDQMWQLAIHTSRPARLAIIAGRESDGISAEMRAAADRLLYLEMHGFTESYNLSVASALVLQRLLDAAAGVRVRFRLGGARFPPTIYYKIFTCSALCDVGAFAPRDYCAARTEEAVYEALLRWARAQVPPLGPLCAHSTQADTRPIPWWPRRVAAAGGCGGWPRRVAAAGGCG